MKKKFQKPDLTISYYEPEDIIASSGVFTSAMQMAKNLIGETDHAFEVDENKYTFGDSRFH